MKQKQLFVLFFGLVLVPFAMLNISCISMPADKTAVKTVILEKINPNYYFVMSPLRAQGASFGPRFGEQALGQLRAALQKMSLNVTELKPGSLTDFAYEIRVSIYEYDYIKKLETWYSIQLCIDMYDSRGLLMATILCLADSSQSSANAMYLDKLLRLCTKELASTLLKRE